MKGAALRGVLAVWLDVDPGAAREWVLKARDYAWPSASSVFASLLYDRDPAAAREFVVALPARRGKVETVERLVSRMVSDDPSEALQWIDSLEGASLRNLAMRVLAREWPQVDLEGAEACLATLDPGVLHQELLIPISRERAEGDPESTLNWLRGTEVASRAQLDRSMGEMMRAWAVEVPDAAAAYYLEHLHELEDAIPFRTLTRMIGLRDPEQALSFVEKLPSDISPALQKVRRGRRLC